MGNDRDWKNRYNRRLLALTLFAALTTALHIYVYFHYFFPASPTGWKEFFLSTLFAVPLDATVLFFSLWLSCWITGGVARHEEPITRENYRTRYTESARVMGWATVFALACWPFAFIIRYNFPILRQTYLNDGLRFLSFSAVLWFSFRQGNLGALARYEQKLVKQNGHGAGPEQV